MHDALKVLLDGVGGGVVSWDKALLQPWNQHQVQSKTQEDRLSE